MQQSIFILFVSVIAYCLLPTVILLIALSASTTENGCISAIINERQVGSFDAPNSQLFFKHFWTMSVSSL